MHYTKDRAIFMDEIVEIMNGFSGNKKYLTNLYGKWEDEMVKEDKEMLPFEAAVVALVEDRQNKQYKYGKALFNYIYWEYDYITHENRQHPFLYDCLNHAMNYVECKGLASFQKKYGKNKINN